jgi:hypothetical protein
MIATFVTWPYGTITKLKERCVILGLKEDSDGLTRIVVASLVTGEVSIANIKEVTVDVDKLRKLPLL